MRRIQHLLFHKTRILLMSLLFVLCMFALPVHAEEPGGDIRFTEPGQDYNVSFDDAPQYKGQKISFTLYNDSSVRLRLDINMQFQRTSAWSDELLADFRQNSISTYAIFEPGESAQFSLDFRSDYAGGTSISIHTSESETADVGGRSFQDAKPTALDENIRGILKPYKGKTENARYFTLDISKRCYVNVKLTSSGSRNLHAYVYPSGITEITSSDALMHVNAFGETKEDTMLLGAGTYTLVVLYQNVSGFDLAEYQLQLGGRDYIPATGILLTCDQKNLTLDAGIRKKPKTLDFTAVTIPENSDDKLFNMSIDGSLYSDNYELSGEMYNLNTNRYRFSITYSASRNYYPGYHTISFNSTNGVTSNALEVLALADKPTLQSYTIYHNKIYFSKYDTKTSNTMNDPVRVYLKSGKKWIKKATAKNGKGFTVKKLKPNKKYQLKFVTLIKRKDGTYAEGKALIKTFRTGRKEKPQIQSISASPVKITTEKKWVKHWDGHNTYHWVLQNYSYSNFSVTVTLKKRLPGIKGLSIGGTAVKGNGRVFKASFQWRGVYKGKQNIDIGSYSQNTDAKGYGPFVKKKIVLK